VAHQAVLGQAERAWTEGQFPDRDDIDEQTVIGVASYEAGASVRVASRQACSYAASWAHHPVHRVDGAAVAAVPERHEGR
jgi:hypothetical protein